MNQNVVTRTAPSPTGKLHIGTARIALYNFLFARKQSGKHLVRSEDTDKERSSLEFEQDILESLSWLEIEHDEVSRQSDRREQHKEAIKKLIDSGVAFVSREKGKQNPTEMVEVVRLKNPQKDIQFTDIVRGDITFNTKELGDFVIARGIDDPLYHLAVVVDDTAMGVTHVIRGEDHISNTPRQILIQEALGYERPQYAHIPLILAPDRSKLSKRRDAVAISEFRKLGYLHEALVNYLALLGWNPGTNQEFFSLDELINSFSLENVQKSGAIFDRVKLNWFNRAYLQKIPSQDLVHKILSALPEEVKQKEQYSEERGLAFATLVLERINSLGEVAEILEEGELDYLFEPPNYEISLLSPKEKQSERETRNHLLKIESYIEEVPDTAFLKAQVKKTVFPYAEKEGKGKVLWPMRVALSGKRQSPDPFILSEILGKEETIARLKKAAQLLKKS